MSENNRFNKSYAYLPEDLLVKILEDTPSTADKLHSLIGYDQEKFAEGIEKLKSKGLVRALGEADFTDSIIAVDGANIVEKMSGSDLLMCIAVGVEGIPDEPAEDWSDKGKQYYQWQTALPHHVANSRLCQGVMFLMELSILANAEQEFRIMDGGHITSILKLNSLLSARAEEFADEAYVEALSDFLKDNYNKVIPDIPNIIDNAFKDDSIVGLVKYSSSREIVDSLLSDLEIVSDDKTFFSQALSGGEYTRPQPVGLSQKERGYWEQAHIRSNLDLGLSEEDENLLNIRLKDTLERFKPSREGGTELYFCYFKPFDGSLCYRIEMKKSLANNEERLSKLLSSIKHQIFFPEIHEPYPQYLADIIVKNVSLGMDALNQALRASEQLSSKDNFNLLLSYRSN